MKKLRMSLKAVAEDGTFAGWLSTFNNVDQGDDRILPGAFAKTLKERGPVVPLLWQHKSDVPVGDLTLTEKPEGLWAEGRLLINDEVPMAKTAYALLKHRVVRGLSIGYETVKSKTVGAVREITEIKLYEGSIVTFPMDEMALITSVKRMKLHHKEDFSTEYAEMQLREAGYQMWQALAQALMPIPWMTDLSKEDRIAAVETSIDQFKSQYMEYIGPYIDWYDSEYAGMETMGRRKPIEEKMGKVVSAATREKLNAAADHMSTCAMHTKSATDILTALMEEEAAEDDADSTTTIPDDDTYKSRAAVKTQTEPAVDHSAVSSTKSLIEEFRALLKSAA